MACADKSLVLTSLLAPHPLYTLARSPPLQNIPEPSLLHLPDHAAGEGRQALLS